MYNLRSPELIPIQGCHLASQIMLPVEHASFIYIPEGKFRSDVAPVDYLVYGALIDIGFIRPAIYKETHFLFEFRVAQG